MLLRTLVTRLDRNATVADCLLIDMTLVNPSLVSVSVRLVQSSKCKL